MQKSKRTLHGEENSNGSGVKKLKKSEQQTNTLLNYFNSNKPKHAVSEPQKTEVKNTILNYFKSENEKVIKKEKSNEINEIEKKVNLNENKKRSIEINKYEIEINDAQNEPENEYAEHVSEVVTSRKCPFYRRVEGTNLVVDAFRYGNIENCAAYFLSHFHYDHYIGLNKHFKNTMYCSKKTANLVQKQIRVDAKYVRALELNKFVNFDDDESVQVALVDANHCPGSVMFLFRLNKLKKYILHTGDFRASDELIADNLLRNIKIDIVYLDTTYLDSYYTFLPQIKIIQKGVELVKKELKEKPNSLIVCGSYSKRLEMVKWPVAQAIAEELDLKIYVNKYKKNIIDCLDDETLNKRVTLDPNETNLHVIPMGQLNIKDLEIHKSKFSSYENLIALKPSGWTHSDNSATSTGVSIVKKSKNITIYGLEYSEHSSFDELRKFIHTIKPKRVIPTVNVASKNSRDKMQSYLNEWMKI